MSDKTIHIDHSNYELFFVDYLDGNLSVVQEEALMAFLEKNPDLGNDLESAAGVKLQIHDAIAFPGKASLFRAEAPFTDLSEADYLLIKESEEGLTEQESSRLSQLMLLSPQLAQERNMYAQVRLKPSTINYPAKSSLKRKAPIGWLWPALKGAAAIAIFITLFNYKSSFDVPGNERDATTILVDNVLPSLTTPEAPETLEFTPPDIQDLTVEADMASSVIQKSTTKDQTALNTSRAELIDPLPAPAIAMLPEIRQLNAYEIGLSLMMPQYVENHQLLASAVFKNTIEQSTEPNSLLGKTTNLLSRITPLNLSFKKIYDEEGELVAFNFKGDNFEIAQRLPRWISNR